MSEIIDLDQIVGELKPHEVKILGKTFWANPDPAVEVLWGMSKLGDIDEGDADGALASIRQLLVEIFDEEAASEILQMCGVKRVLALVEALVEAYEREGKAPGSSRASRRAGVRSRPTSGTSTTSTSRKRASALPANGSAAAISTAS